MKVNDVQFTQLKWGKYEYFLRENKVEISYWGEGVEDLYKPSIESFSIIFKVMERSILKEQTDRFFDTYLTIGLFFVGGTKVYGHCDFSDMFETREDERKFIEYLIHRKDVLRASKRSEKLYEYLKDKPRIDGHTEYAEMYDEKQEAMVNTIAYVDYEE